MTFVVGSRNRGRGIGRALIRAAEERAGERGAGHITLTTHKRRAGARRFYRRMGYEDTGYRFYKTL
jgi:ribosomal protein S18 acetylase RimI-like enzyme